MANANALVTLGTLTTYNNKVKAYVLNRDGKTYTLEQNATDASKYDLKQTVASATGTPVTTVIGSITTASMMTSGSIVTDPSGLAAGKYLKLDFAAGNSVYVNIADLVASNAASDISVSTISGMTASNVQAAIAELKTTLDAKAGGTYTLEKVTDPAYSAVYKLKQTVGSTSSYVGDPIQIPKDMVVNGGSVGECTLANNPISGLKVGDKYLDFTIANSAEHVYVNLASLVRSSADKITYSNSTSGLIATNVQAAIDEVKTKSSTSDEKLNAIIEALGAVTTKLQTILGSAS